MSSQVVCTAKLARPVSTMPVDAASGMAQWVVSEKLV